ncbi:MAG: hypothetical protein ACLVJ8_09075 [Ruthenibacterium lactatiformans]
MQTMQQYITEMGLEYSQKQFDACLTAFVSEMERGLAGGASSLKMIPAYLDAQAPPSDGGPVIAIDMGGTNLRIALIEWKNSRMHFLDRRQYPMPGTQGNLERSEFFEQIAEYLLPIADQSARIGLCFSFPCEILPTLEGKVLISTKKSPYATHRGRCSVKKSTQLCRDPVAASAIEPASSMTRSLHFWAQEPKLYGIMLDTSALFWGPAQTHATAKKIPVSQNRNFSEKKRDTVSSIWNRAALLVLRSIG